MERAPWIPNDLAWARILDACRIESLRNRLMVALAYDGALRREELVQIEIDDLEPAYSLIHLRAETTKSKRARDVAFGTATGQLLVGYLKERGRMFWTRERSALSQHLAPEPGRPVGPLRGKRPARTIHGESKEVAQCHSVLIPPRPKWKAI